jgi:hypothetical protein
VIKERGIRWLGHIVRIRDKKIYTGFWCEKLETKRLLAGPRSICKNIKLNLKE